MGLPAGGHGWYPRCGDPAVCQVPPSYDSVYGSILKHIPNMSL